MISRFSIATLVIFICSIAFVIHPLSVPIRLPYVGHKRLHINLTTAPICAIALLWAAQCLGPTQVFLLLFLRAFTHACQIRDGIVGTGEKFNLFCSPSLAKPQTASNRITS
jgi:hypothetical protein